VSTFPANGRLRGVDILAANYVCVGSERRAVRGSIKFQRRSTPYYARAGFQCIREGHTAS